MCATGATADIRPTPAGPGRHRPGDRDRRGDREAAAAAAAGAAAARAAADTARAAAAAAARAARAAAAAAWAAWADDAGAAWAAWAADAGAAWAAADDAAADDARAAWAAADTAAARAARAAARAAAWSDLDRFIALNLGKPDTPGVPIDPSEAGPLGPLWPQGVPEWYTEAGVVQHVAVTDTASSGESVQVEVTPQPAPQVFAYFDGSGFTPEEVAHCLGYLSEVYRDLGGAGLKVAGTGQTLVPEGVRVKP